MSAEFIDAMRAAGVDPSAREIIPDGAIHRFRGPGDKPGRENCWYVLFEHGGAFGSWRLGISEKWHNGAAKLSKQERRKLDQQIKAAQTQAEAERKARQGAAAEKARRLLNLTVAISEPCEHDYLLYKHIQPHGVRRLHNLLVIPLYAESGEIVNLQFISPGGEKRFLSDGRVAGCYYLLADETPRRVARIAIAEGFATAASIDEATAFPVAAAFNAGNLLAVAKALREKYRDAEIVLCADDDRATEGNPGVTKAQGAARQVDARLAIPVFPAGIHGTDFNDLANEVGLDAVRRQILAAVDFGIPANFKLTKETLYLLREHEIKGQIETEEIPICSRLEVVALTRDTNGSEWGRLLRFADPDGRVHEWAMPTEMLAGDGTEYRARLLEQGLSIWPTKDARYGLHGYISQCRPVARATAVTCVGWHQTVFVLPDAVFGDTQGERTLYQSAVAVAHAFNARGSLEEWRREVAALCIGNSRLLFAVSAAFAAALLYLTNDESGGFHYVGHSSLGKTTALRVAGSVWGGSPAQHGYLRQWRATANGLEGIAALHSDTLLCLDELSEVSPREAGNIAYMLANGQGKGRARRDGSARPAFVWRVVFLSSGELTLADKVREDDRQRATAGQQVRVLDIRADAEVGFGLFETIHGASNPQEFADRLRAATQNCYGTAARAFLFEIVKQPSGVADAIRKYRDDFIEQHCPPGVDGQVRRAATRFGLAAAAGELAIAFGITGWPEGAADQFYPRLRFATPEPEDATGRIPCSLRIVRIAFLNAVF
jgi:putative DNA primase/helicase